MRILFVIGPLERGGAERVVCNLSNELIKNNEVLIATTISDKSDYYLDKRIKVISLDTCNRKNFISKNIVRIINLKKIIKNYNIDFAISFLPEPSYRLMLVKNKRVKTIISDRNDPNQEYRNIFKKILTNILYSRSDGFVFQTPDAKKYFSKKIQKRSTIIPNPINESFLVEKPYTGKRTNRIVAVGRLTKQKNQDLLLEAFSFVHKKYNDYILEIYGEGELKKELQSHILSLGLEKSVILKGNSNQLYNDIYDAKMFVLSSDYEGMPNALMEAMALGIPCISTDCPIGGPKFLIENKKNGLLIPTNNVTMLVDSIFKLIEDDNLSQEISLNCFNDSKKYNNNEINKMWERYIKKIYNNKGI